MSTKPMTIAGKYYPSHRAAAEAFRIDPRTMNLRLFKGWTPEEAAGLTKRNQTPSNWKAVLLNSKTYPSLSAAARAYGISADCIASRLHIGWSIEEAFGVTKRVRSTGTKVTVAGRIFQSISAAARSCGLSANTVRVRLRQGWTLEEALALNPRRNPRWKEVTVGGNTYPSISAAARAFGIPVQRVFGRLHMGWSFEKAFTLEKRKKIKRTRKFLRTV